MPDYSDGLSLTVVLGWCARLSPVRGFQISHLKNGSPATVSRAGVLFLNETDVGWRPLLNACPAATARASQGRRARPQARLVFAERLLIFVIRVHIIRRHCRPGRLQ